MHRLRGMPLSVPFVFVHAYSAIVRRSIILDLRLTCVPVMRRLPIGASIRYDYAPMPAAARAAAPAGESALAPARSVSCSSLQAHELAGFVPAQATNQGAKFADGKTGQQVDA